MSRVDICKSCLRGRVRFDGRVECTNRPIFKCGYCNHAFTNGQDGGELAHLVPTESPAPPTGAHQK
jgi:hypothetical protein